MGAGYTIHASGPGGVYYSRRSYGKSLFDIFAAVPRAQLLDILTGGSTIWVSVRKPLCSKASPTSLDTSDYNAGGQFTE